MTVATLSGIPPVAATRVACNGPACSCDTAPTEPGPALPDRGAAPASTAARVQRNPYVVALHASGGFAWLVAVMLWIVLAEVTDYVAYDRGTAAALAAWMMQLLLAGTVAFVGASVIAGVRYELHRAHRK